MFWLNFENDPKLGVLTKNMCIPIEKKTCFLFVSHDHSLTKSSKLKTICSGVVPGICVLELYTGYMTMMWVLVGWLDPVFFGTTVACYSVPRMAHTYTLPREALSRKHHGTTPRKIPHAWNHAEKNPARMESAYISGHIDSISPRGLWSNSPRPSISCLIIIISSGVRFSK